MSKFEPKPASFYSFRVSLIFLRVAHRLPPEEVDWLQRREILPPPRLREAALRNWLAGAKAGWLAKRTVVFESRPAPTPPGQWRMAGQWTTESA